jgi:short subunit dehydrogenase-like uncharacterized protein
MSGREFEVIVWGATGYTGRLVAAHLLATYGAAGDLKWAMAGRSAAKLAEVKAEIGAPAALPAIVADADDPASLEAMARRADVVITTVGPYQLYGAPLVAACAAAGTDYVDLTGESNWIAAMIAENEAAAKVSGARIVFSCGFDSIPFDLGVWFVQQEAKQRFGAYSRRVRGRVRGLKGGLSGGTLASGMATQAAAAKDPAITALLADPFALTPGFKGAAQPDGETPYEDQAAGAWVGPFMMAGINTKAVHRTNFLAGHPWGEGFQYCEMRCRFWPARHQKTSAAWVASISARAAYLSPARALRARSGRLASTISSSSPRRPTGAPYAPPSRATWTPATARPPRSSARPPSASPAMFHARKRPAAAGPPPPPWTAP